MNPIRLPDIGGPITLFNAKGERIDREVIPPPKPPRSGVARGKNQPLNFHPYRLELKPSGRG